MKSILMMHWDPMLAPHLSPNPTLNLKCKLAQETAKRDHEEGIRRLMMGKILLGKPPRLHSADIAAIARRVVEMMKENKV